MILVQTVLVSLYWSHIENTVDKDKQLVRLFGCQVSCINSHNFYASLLDQCNQKKRKENQLSCIRTKNTRDQRSHKFGLAGNSFLRFAFKRHSTRWRGAHCKAGGEQYQRSSAHRHLHYLLQASQARARSVRVPSTPYHPGTSKQHHYHHQSRRSSPQHSSSHSHTSKLNKQQPLPPPCILQRECQ